MTPFIELFDGPNSRSVPLFVVERIVADPSRIQELMDCFFDDRKMICQRAAWPLGMIADDHPHLLMPYLEQLLATIEGKASDTVVRNVLRAFQFMDFPEDQEGRVFDICFEFLLDVNKAIAIRVFGMTVSANIAMKYPILAEELIPVIEEHIPHGSAGFRSRGSKLLHKLRGLST